MEKTLKEKTITALVWNFIDKFGQQIIYTIVSIVLARLLLPDEFGMVGVLAIFTAVATVLIDSGFGYSLIREKNARDIDFSTAFVFNICIGIILYLILFFCAPLIPLFYNKPIPVTLIRILFLSIPISSLGVVQNILLTKNIRFEITTRVNLIALLVSGTAGITMALSGFGVWALVSQILTQTVCRTTLLWIWGKWEVSFKFDMQALKKSFNYSINLLLSGIFNAIFNNVYSSIIGKYFQFSQTGFYSQAGKVADMPKMVVAGTIQTTMFPIMASIHDDDERFKRAARKTVRACAFLISPIMAGLVCMAKPLFIIALTHKWAPAIPYFQLLCCVGLFFPLTSINLNFLYAKGKSSVVLRLEMIKIVITLAVLVYTIRYGIICMLVGQICVQVLSYLLSVIFGGRRIGYSFIEQMRDIMPYVVISAIMALLMYLWTLCISNLYLLATTQIITGLAFYIIINKLLGSKIFEEVLELILRPFKKK